MAINETEQFYKQPKSIDAQGLGEHEPHNQPKTTPIPIPTKSDRGEHQRHPYCAWGPQCQPQQAPERNRNRRGHRQGMQTPPAKSLCIAWSKKCKKWFFNYIKMPSIIDSQLKGYQLLKELKVMPIQDCKEIVKNKNKGEWDVHSWFYYSIPVFTLRLVNSILNVGKVWTSVLWFLKLNESA